MYIPDQGVNMRVPELRVFRSPALLIWILAFCVSDDLKAQLATTCTSPGQPVLNVPGGYATIQAAINAAPAGACILVAPGTYVSNLQIDGRYVELKAASSDVSQTVLDGGQSAAVVVFQHLPWNPAVSYTPAARISGFTIQNGFSATGQGGGITLANRAEVIVENNVIRNNTSSSDGGGILVYNQSHGTIRNNLITGNKAPRFGGGILVVGDLNGSPAGASNPIIFGNTITNNSVTGYAIVNGGASGGGILAAGYSSPFITGNTITGNSAPFAGGGIFLGPGVNAYVEENTIDGNSATYGGGIHLETHGGAPVISNNYIRYNNAVPNGSFTGAGFGGGIAVYAQSVPSIFQNTILENTASYGGGGIVVAEGGVAAITSNAISGNIVNGSTAGSPVGPPPGGGIYVSQASADITNNLIYSNSSGYGGGVGLLGGGSVPTVANIRNNTIVSNTATAVPGSASGTGGGGLFVHVNGNCTPATNTTVVNNIFDSNAGFQIFEACKGGATFTNNLVNNASSGMYFNYTSHAVTNIATFNASVAGAGNISGNTAFANAAGNDFRLTALSAAIDRGNSSASPLEDYANMNRPAGNGMDIGAYEYTSQSVAKSAVFEFYSFLYNGHFYTQSRAEKNLILSAYPYGLYRYYGIAFNAYPAQLSGTVPVYRFFSSQTQGHYYTPDLCEMFVDCQLHPPGDPHNIYADDVWRYISIAFYVYPNQTPLSVPVYWFFSPVTSHHFFTSNETEKNALMANPTALQWTYEGPKWYVR